MAFTRVPSPPARTLLPALVVVGSGVDLVWWVQVCGWVGERRVAREGPE